MEKTIAILALVLFFVAGSIPQVNARKEENREENEVKVEISNKADINNTVVGSVNGSGRFEISGTVDSFSDNTVTVNGQKIIIDPSLVESFEQKGKISVGEKIKIEGTVKNNTYFAREINITGTGQGRFKIEIEGKEKPKPSATTAPTGQPGTSLTPAITPNVSPTGNTTLDTSAGVRIEVKAKGAAEEVKAFLEQILAFLKNLV